MSKKMVLRSSDGQSFEVDEAVAVQSVFLKRLWKDGFKDNSLTNITGNVLNKIVEFCKKHVDENTEHKLWDASFISNVDLDTLFDLMVAANYLYTPKLLDLTLNTVAAMMENKDIDDLRKLFNIKGDYTAEEEAQFRQENQWAFED